MSGIAVRQRSLAGASEPLRNLISPPLARMLARGRFSSKSKTTFWNVFGHLTHDSLALPHRHEGKRFSGICRDGSPWQFCAVIGPVNPAPVRFLTEVGRWGDTLPERTALAASRIPQAIHAAGHSTSTSDMGYLVRAIPDDNDHFAGLWIGVATGASAPARFRVYANIGWGGAEDRWLRLIRLLGDFDAQKFASRMFASLAPLLDAFVPAGFAVTMPSDPQHIKLYFRPFASPWAAVRQLAEAVCSQEFTVFLGQIEKSFGQSFEQLKWRSLVLSLSGPVDGGSWDIKLDFCCHCLFETGLQAIETVERLAAACNFNPSPCHAMLDDMGTSPEMLSPDAVAFIGIGANRKGTDRINVYFSPDAVSPDCFQTSVQHVTNCSAL